MKFKRGDLVKYTSTDGNRMYFGVVLNKGKYGYLVYWLNDQIFLFGHETLLKKIKI